MNGEKGSYTMVHIAKDNSTPPGSKPNEAQDDVRSYRLMSGAEEHEPSWNVEAGQLFMLQDSQDTARGLLRG